MTSRTFYPIARFIVLGSTLNIATLIREYTAALFASFFNLLCRLPAFFNHSHITFSFHIHNLQSPKRQPPIAYPFVSGNAVAPTL